MLPNALADRLSWIQAFHHILSDSDEVH